MRLFLILEINDAYIWYNPLFSRVGDSTASVSSQGYPWVLFNVLAGGVKAYTMLHLLQSLSAVILVGLGLSDPKYWPKLFGNWKDAYTVRRFWG